MFNCATLILHKSHLVAINKVTLKAKASAVTINIDSHIDVFIQPSLELLFTLIYEGMVHFHSLWKAAVTENSCYFIISLLVVTGIRFESL